MSSRPARSNRRTGHQRQTDIAASACPLVLGEDRAADGTDVDAGRKAQEDEMGIEFDFAALDEARRACGHSYEAACACLLISRSTWNNWRKGRSSPRPAILAAVVRYIKDADDARRDR